MKRLLCAALLLLSIPTLSAAQETSLKAARQRLLRGNYEEAISQYQTLAQAPATRSAAVLGLSRTHQAQGEFDKALSVVDKALEEKAGQADLLARRAELLYLRGRWDEAEKAAESVLAGDRQHVLARWVRAQIYRDRGDLKKADSALRWFTRLYNETEVAAADDLLHIGLASAEYSRWHKDLADQFEFIINEIYNGILKNDKDYWPAEYQVGLLLLEKYNRPQALAAFDKVLTINPSAAEALVGKGLAALEHLEIKEAESLGERALKINPRLPEALRLVAQVRLLANDVRGAHKDLEEARKVNPRDERTLGGLAACLFLQRKHAEVEALVQEVTRYNPAPGLFYHELAARLEGRRWYEPAEKYYHKAVELHPRLAGPRNSLGLLYMRLGQEDEARKILTTAFEMDPFNVRVANMLKVLRHLDKYDALKSEHFALRYDPKNDRALVHFMAEFLEEVYTGLAKQYNYHPPRPILVEIFNTHEMFSGRVVALPDLHTIGACTGRMVAMMSPQGKRNGLKITPFNWARVLRHELVHIFNLEQTNFLAPHWLTEGLAVANEGYPRPQSWNEMLLQRVPAGDLMTLEDIDLGFIRPRSPQEWKLAYCQSQLYVDYLIQVYGEKSIGDMLAAYRDGLDTGAAVARACRVDRAVFEKGYRAYLDSMTRGLKGKPPVKPQTFTQLREAHKKDPHNVDVTARLAEQYFSRDKAESRKLAGEALAGKAGHPLASYVLARLELAGGNPAGASKLLEAGLDRTEPEPKVLRELGKIYYNASQFDRAVEIFELGRKVEPYERQWLIELGRVQAQLGNRDRQIEVLTALVPTDPDDFDNRKRLARLLMEAGRFAEAERYGKQALEIDFRDQEAREIYEKALRSQNKKEQADRFQKVFSK